MSSNSLKAARFFTKPGLFDKGLGAMLPEAYRKFYKEWRETEPTAVHFIPEQGSWRRDEVTGEVFPIQNIPLPLKYPVEHHNHIWGGEAIVQGFRKRTEKIRRVPHFWIPTLMRTVVYSEILDKYISVVVTQRTINLIHSNYGFDHYILKTPACDLKSLMAVGLKRMMLQALEKGCPEYEGRTKKQSEILAQYKSYLTSYTPEEIKWYGYSFTEACKMVQQTLDKQNEPVPLKQIYRANLIEELKAAEAAGRSLEVENTSSASWLQKINPFAKKQET